MSYIRRTLNGELRNDAITNFLLKEGFKYGSGASGEGQMYYVASGNYTVWFALCENHLSLYAEYDCGGEVGSNKCYFEENDFRSFMKAYKEAVDWASEYM